MQIKVDKEEKKTKAAAIEGVETCPEDAKTLSPLPAPKAKSSKSANQQTSVSVVGFTPLNEGLLHPIQVARHLTS